MREKKHLVIFDDREHVTPAIANIVGERAYGKIRIRKQLIGDRFAKLISDLGIDVLQVNVGADFSILKSTFTQLNGASVTVIPGRAGILASDSFSQLILRLKFLEKSFFDRDRSPLISYFPTEKEFLQYWDSFVVEPLHLQNRFWDSGIVTEPVDAVVDISNLDTFLKFISQSTEARHFNEMQVEEHTFRKTSRDVLKITKEHNYFYLIPARMQAWLVQPFDLKVSEQQASYEMLRYHVADASFQWIHQAWSKASFAKFLGKLFSFLSNRATRQCDETESLKIADDLFLTKVEELLSKLKSSNVGSQVISLLAAGGVNLDEIVARYRRLYQADRSLFKSKVLTIGHGDSCLSNILYDQQHMLLKLIDPKGALSEAELWTHPLYDFCKLSHSILGSYDFINHGLFDVSLNQENRFQLSLETRPSLPLQAVFKSALAAEGINLRAIRIAECSLFLSMLPLHLDHPKKVTAFVLNAKRIIEEIENGRQN